MKTEEKILYGKKGLWLEHDDLDVFVTTEVGPRILHLSLHGGENVLWVDEAGEKGRGGWRIYGGHRLWIAPETETSYEPDDNPPEVEIGKDYVRTRTKPDILGLQKSMCIRPAAEGGMLVEHEIINTSEMLAPASAWAITCVKKEGYLFIPWGSGNKRWDMGKLVFWKRWGGNHSTRASAVDYTLGDTLLRLKPGKKEGKIGTFAEEGWIAMCTENITFVKAITTRPRGGSYPDEGCNIEVYMCEDFMEMETLSPVAFLRPGDTIVHTEKWLLWKECVTDDEDVVAERIRRRL